MSMKVNVSKPDINVALNRGATSARLQNGVAIMNFKFQPTGLITVTKKETNVAGRILVIDDDREFLINISEYLTKVGYRVTTAETVEEGIRLAATLPFHVCLLDRSIGYDSGLDALPKLRELAPLMRIIMVTGHAGVEEAINTMAQGASDYLVKPCSPEQLRIAVARQVDTRRMIERIDSLEREHSSEKPALSSKSETMRAAISLAFQVAVTDANILILGESGTGKGVIARAIHQASNRSSGSLVTVNCPSLSQELLESEMFGHIKGSFTGAVQSNVGRVSHADGGTIFLDEVGDFPLSLQPKLLRFIQDKEYERVGDPVTRKIDARILAATNHDLDSMVKEGSFRLDLLYRLNVITITLPPLRERIEDLEDLATGFILRFAASYGMPARRLSSSGLSLLQRYSWPGNVRELQNMMERSVILSRTEEIGIELLALGDVECNKHEALPGSPVSLETLERTHIERVLATSENLDVAAKILGIDASTLYRKRKAFKM